MTALAPSILVLEDEPLIALDIGDMLDRAGYTDLTLLNTCAACHDYLVNATPSLAIVDISLMDGDCVDIVKILVSRKVRLIVASGVAKSDANEVFTQGAWIAKPWSPIEFMAAVKTALEQPTSKHIKRPRGVSPRGVFDESKREADLIIVANREAEQHKT
jgi:DNA-binding response OmpR family regulator